jgi:hypothetical protein
MDRIAVIARLKHGSEEKARGLVATGPPFDPRGLGIVEHSVFIGNGFVVFVFEGDGLEKRLADLANDPVRSAAFGAWAPILVDAPRLAHEAYHWPARKEDQ